LRRSTPGISTGYVDGVDTSEGSAERIEDGNAREERWVEAVKYISLDTVWIIGHAVPKSLDEPRKCFSPCLIDALYDGATLLPLHAPIPFAIQGGSVDISTFEHLKLLL
jgi:hypothetical protein